MMMLRFCCGRIMISSPYVSGLLASSDAKPPPTCTLHKVEDYVMICQHHTECLCVCVVQHRTECLCV